MQQVSLKLSALAVVTSVALTPLVVNQVTTADQSHQQNVNQFLAGADKALDNGSVTASKPISMPAGHGGNLPANHPPLNGSATSAGHNVGPGAKEDFLEMSPGPNWQSVEQGEGIASAKYRLQLDDVEHQLAIIRMNKEVPLDTVINIWKQKAGLGQAAKIEYQAFSNNYDQAMYITALKGPFKLILLAIHKGEKYTFFRLTGKQDANGQAMAEFKKLLADTKIISP